MRPHPFVHMFSSRQWLLRTPVGGGLVVALLALAAWMTLVEPAVAWLYIGVCVLLATFHLRVHVDADTIRLTWFPIWRRTIRLDDVHTVQRVPYRWTQFGGWGIRLGRGAVAYSMWGKKAVRLDVGRRFDVVIQTPEADELADTLRTLGVDSKPKD